MSDPMSRFDTVVQEVTGGRHKSLHVLVDRWRKFVGSVEIGYPFTVYDYHDDLDIRGLLQDVLDRLTAAEQTDIVKSIDLADLDSRFMAATRATNKVIATRDSGRWANRVPIRPGPELE